MKSNQTRFLVELSFMNGKEKRWETFFAKKFSNALWNSTKDKIYNLIRDAYNKNDARSEIKDYVISVTNLNTKKIAVSETIESYSCVYDKGLPEHFASLVIPRTSFIMRKDD